MKKVAFCVAHPDDELIVFGSAFLDLCNRSDYEVHVILFTTPNQDRLNNFLTCCNKLNVSAFLLNLPDNGIDVGIENFGFMQKLTDIFRNNEYEFIFVHDIFYGDNGCHQMHIDSGIVSGHLFKQLYPERPVLMKYFYGYSDKLINFTMSKETWEQRLSLLRDFYIDEIMYLEWEKYPLTISDNFVDLEKEIFDSYMLRLIYDEEIPPEGLSLIEDAWFVRKSAYELNKSKEVSKLYSDWFNKKNIKVLLDIGSGTGNTLKHIVNDCEGIVQIIACEQSTKYHEELNLISNKILVKQYIDEKMVVDAINFGQSIYYFKKNDLRKFLNKISFKYCIVENIDEEYHKLLLSFGMKEVFTHKYRALLTDTISNNYNPIVMEEFDIKLYER
jgi:LmbE family N-acetylglucosaminyl deacetylase